MIDIHNHTLYGVDDGPGDIALSLDMLRSAEAQGITDVILTPHYRRRMFAYDIPRIDANLAELKERAAGIGVRLHLGCEIHYHEDMPESLRRGRVRTLAGSDYVLTEYAGDDPYDRIWEMTHRLRSAGYRPVIAHVERIDCLRRKPKLCEELQDEGAWIQTNAMAVLGREGFSTGLFTAKLLKHGWVDVIASDTHNLTDRPNPLKEAYGRVEDRYGHETAELLLCENPARILRQAHR